MAGRKATEADARLGARLRSARLARGITQRAIAGELGVSAYQLAKYETGVNAISAVTLGVAARLLGLPVAAFLDPIEGTPEQAFDLPRELVREVVSTVQSFERRHCRPLREVA